MSPAETHLPLLMQRTEKARGQQGRPCQLSQMHKPQQAHFSKSLRRTYPGETLTHTQVQGRPYSPPLQGLRVRNAETPKLSVHRQWPSEGDHGHLHLTRHVRGASQSAFRPLVHFTLTTTLGDSPCGVTMTEITGL